jgi:hypothetical protein
MKRYAVKTRRGVFFTADTRGEAEAYLSQRSWLRGARVADLWKKPSRIKRVPTPERFAALSQDGRALGEKNDCCVVTLAAAGDIPYEQAHAMLKKRGRRNGRGANGRDVLAALRELGFAVERVPVREMIDRYPGVHRNLKNVTTHHPRRFPAAWRGKSYVMMVRAHILAVVDGEVQDWTVNRAKQAQELYEVKRCITQQTTASA